MALTDAQWAAVQVDVNVRLIAGAITEAQAVAELAAATENWPTRSLSNADLALRVSKVLANLGGLIETEGPPSMDVGAPGARAFDSVNIAFYGPKTVESWGPPRSLIGNPGPAIELRDSGGFVQWRVVGAETWINLISLDNPSFQTVKLTKGSVETDNAGLGPELLDGTGWTSAGWTGSVNNWSHTPGNTSPLSRALSGVAAGKSYLVVMTISGSTAGSVSLSLGSTILDDSAGTIPLFTGNKTFTRGVKVAGTGPFTVTPTSNFDGTVLLSVSELSAVAPPIFATDSSSAVNLEILPGQASRRNVFVGGGGKMAYSASQCTAVGRDALRDVISGNSNTGIGHSALRDLTSGLFNTAVGGGCGVSLTTGWYNTAVGGDALAFTTTGYNNSAFGVDALYRNTTGFNNTALGFSASFNNLGGSGNTSVGFKALFTNTVGTENVAVGSGALEKATTNQNTAVGASSLINCTTGGANTALGRGSLTSLTTGGTNTAIGGVAGFAHTTGSQNVYVGYGSGYTETPANANLTGANNVYVGYQAGPGVTAQLANAIGVGYRSHPTKSNQAVFGNNLMVETVYYGVLLPGTAYTVSSLPAATAGLKGARAHVTDATAPTYLGALTGGGSVACPVFCNGSAWVAA